MFRKRLFSTYCECLQWKKKNCVWIQVGICIIPIYLIINMAAQFNGQNEVLLRPGYRFDSYCGCQWAVLYGVHTQTGDGTNKQNPSRGLANRLFVALQRKDWHFFYIFPSSSVVQSTSLLKKGSEVRVLSGKPAASSLELAFLFLYLLD